MPSKTLLHEVIISEFINQICNFVQIYLIQFASDVDFWVPGVNTWSSLWLLSKTHQS